MRRSSSKKIRPGLQDTCGAGWPWPRLLGSTVRRTSFWLCSGPSREHPVKSAVKLGITVILLSALSVALGSTVGVLGIAVTIMAVMLLLAVGLATGTLAGRGRQKDQVVWVPPGQLIPADGEVVDGTALVDEST